MEVVRDDSLIRFDSFELNPRTGELRKHGIRIRLADQPFRILIALLDRPGELVQREELRQRIWPGDTAGDFEQGLNRAVSKLREALSDKASTPRFIETLSGRGYRFIGTLDRQTPLESKQLRWNDRRPLFLIAGTLVVLAIVATAARLLSEPDTPRLRWRKLTTDNYRKVSPALSDGTRIYFAASFGGEQFIAQVPLTGGQPAKVPLTPPGPVFSLHDLSPDGQDLLLTAAPSNNRLRALPLWTLRIADGTARRLGAITATSAAYSPSGNEIAHSTPTELWIVSKDGSEPRRLVELKDSLLDSVCWSSDQKRIRFSRRNPLSNQASPWEIEADGRGLRQILTGWENLSLSPSGWTADSRLALFGGGGTFWATVDTWASFRGKQVPERLIEDAPEFDSSVRIRNAGVYHAIGTDRLGELQYYDQASGNWIPLLEGMSAEAVEYSPDRQRVAYVNYPQRTLWVRQADGSRPIQLTSPPLVVGFPRWSPDGRRIAFSAVEAENKPMRLYIIDADGGPVRPAFASEHGSQGYPTWSPDGKKLVYGLINSSTREDVFLRVADIETGKVTRFDGSEGLFAPRWSPDGTMLAALQWSEQRHLMLYRVKDGKWEEVQGRRVDWPTWSWDSKSILGKSADSLIRYRVDTKKFDVLTELRPEEMGGYWRWIGVGLDGSPLRILNRDNRQIYALQFEKK